MLVLCSVLRIHPVPATHHSLASSSCTGFQLTYVEVLQVLWHHISADLIPLNNISSVLGVSSSRSRPSSLVEPLVGHLSGQLQEAGSALPLLW